MPYTVANPQTSTPTRNYLSVVDIDSIISGSGVYIGNGVVLTAGHVISHPSLGVIPGVPIELSFAEGVEWSQYGGNLDFSGNTSTLPQSDFYLNSFTNFGAFGAEDFGIARINPSGSHSSELEVVEDTVFDNPMIIFADPNDAYGTLWTAGYVAGGGPVPGVGNSETLTETSTNGPVDLQYTTTVAENTNGDLASFSTWNVSATTGYQLFNGFSGSGAWLTYNGQGVSGTFLAGIVSLAGPTSSQIEPIGDGYQALAGLLFNPMSQGGLGLNPIDFATNVLIADDIGGQFQGTQFNEHFYGSAEQDILFGNGGNDEFHLMNQPNRSWFGQNQEDDLVIGGNGFDDTVVYSSLSVNGYGLNAFTIEAMNYGLGYEITYSYSYQTGQYWYNGTFFPLYTTDTKKDTLIGVENIEVDGVTYSLAALAPPPTINPFDPFRSLKSTQDNSISSDEYGMDNFMEPSMFDQPDTFDFYEFA